MSKTEGTTMDRKHEWTIRTWKPGYDNKRRQQKEGTLFRGQTTEIDLPQ